MGYRISVRTPGARARDYTPHAVTIEEDGTPWPIVLRFLHWTDDDGGASYWRNISFELDQATEAIDEYTGTDELPEVDPVTLERIAKQYPLFLRLARDAIEFELPAVAEGVAMLRKAGRGRRGLSDEFLRRIAAEHEDWRRRGERHIATRIKEAHDPVELSTVTRWIKRAAERGFLKEGK